MHCFGNANTFVYHVNKEKSDKQMTIHSYISVDD